MGWYQVLMVSLLACYPLCEAAVMLTINTQSRALQKEWSLSGFQTGSLASISFAGLALGTYASGFLADLRGRRSALLTSFLLMALVGGLTPLATGYGSMLMFQLCMGVAAGMGVPASQAMLTEISPAEWRPSVFVFCNSFSIVGEAYACLGMIRWMPDLEDPAHWRALNIWVAIPPALSLLAALGLMQESAHWLAVKGRVAEARLVLMHMAQMNGRPEAVASLGPAEEADDAGTDGALAQPAGRGTSLGRLLALVCSGGGLTKLLLFSVLCVAGNMVTFGMGYFWPTLLRVAAGAGEGQAFGSPAAELLVLRLLGLPANLVTLSAVAMENLGHRGIICVCGPLGALSLLAVTINTSSPTIICSNIVTTIAGSTSYSVTLMFLNESFPTQIRSTAVGFAIMLGRAGAMAAPLLVERLGGTAFACVAASAFLATSAVVLPLRETKGQELGDFADAAESAPAMRRASPPSPRGGAAAAVGVPDPPLALDPRRARHGAGRGADGEAEPEGLGDDPRAVVPDPPLAAAPAPRLLAEGTLGARIEPLLIAAGLGVLPGVASSAYLSSVGYFADSLATPDLFVWQLAAVLGAASLATLLTWGVDQATDRPAARRPAASGPPLRTVLSSELLAAAVLATATVESRDGLLALGAAVGALAATLLACGLELASTGDTASVLWVHAGAALGAALPVPLSLLSSFGPGASQGERLAFFAVPAAMCLLGGAALWRQRRPLGGQAQPLLQPGEPASELAEAPAAAQAEAANRPTWVPAAVGAAWLGALLAPACATFLVVLLTRLGSPREAQSLFFYKVSGELIGRLLSLAAWGRCARHGLEGPPEPGFPEGPAAPGGAASFAAPPPRRGRSPNAAAGGPHPPPSQAAEPRALPEATGPGLLAALLNAAQVAASLALVVHASRPGGSIASLARPASSEALLWSVFGAGAVGATASSHLDALVPLSAAPAAPRHSLMRVQTLVGLAGAVAGLALAAGWDASQAWSTVAPDAGAGGGVGPGVLLGLAGQLGIPAPALPAGPAPPFREPPLPPNGGPGGMERSQPR
ncbi:unnamed protein product, partial [Prorocentrum cordatum]